jgi:hypothetical protein
VSTEWLAEFGEMAGNGGVAIGTMTVSGKAILFDGIPVAHD